MKARPLWIVVGSAIALAGMAEGATVSLHIPSEDAGKSIPELARQTGVLIIGPGTELHGVITPEVKGSFDVIAALEMMLKGTDLKASLSEEGVVTISSTAKKRVDSSNEGESMTKRSKLTTTVSLLAMAAAMQYAAAQGTNADGAENGPIETVTVKGYRASLTSSTNAKRNSVSFTDQIFSEDIGKFPDTNIAEAFNRIPGIQITREINGEGMQISIRGLGTNFTKILLNGAPVAVASTGRTDSQSTNREVDLNMFPTELFTNLTVAKSSTADMVEGGAAGTVNMRSMRPFDNPGAHFTYSLQGQDGTVAAKMGERGTLIASDTWGKFGALVGVSLNHSLVKTKGFESVFWADPKLNAAQCGNSADCNSTGSTTRWIIPSSVPNNGSTIGAGLTPGETINQAWLLAHNPGLTIGQIDNALVPTIGRPSEMWGHRDRANAVVSLEYQPSDALNFYFDFIGGRIVNDEQRTDMMFRIKNSNGTGSIPLNLTVDGDGVVTGGTFANAQLFLEDRYYLEKEDFLSFNPGMKWQPIDLLQIEFQANSTRSHFFRDAPSIGLFTDIETVKYSNATGSKYPTFDAGLDPNAADNWGWAGQRAYIQQEFRYTYTNGLHLDASYGGDEMKLTAGIAYDDTYRKITGRDNSGAWQAAVCGGNPSVYLPSPNSQPVCDGVNATHPSYPGYGTGYSAGFDNIVWQGSFIPESEVKNYLTRGDDGYANVDWKKLKAATRYDDYTRSAPESTYTNTGALVGMVDEKTVGSYWQLNGSFYPDAHELNYNVGLRWVETHQTIGGPVSIADTRNVDLKDGGDYPATLAYAYTKNVYQAFLPSLNVVYNVADNVQLRFAASRTMTRPDPNAMLPNVGFSDPSADIATVGNPALKPYYSNNLDFSVAYFTGAEGYVSLSGFRKSISGFTIQGLTTHPFSELSSYGITYNTLTNTQKTAIDSRGGAEKATVEFSQNVNASGLLTINGVEFSWVQPLDFLLSRYGLNGFGFTANLTIVDQRGSGAAPATAIGVSPYTYNIVGYYEDHGLSVHLSYVFNDKQQATTTNQASITNAAIFTNAYNQMDLSASYKLSGLFGDIPSDPEVTLNVQNLTNSAQSQYFEYSGATFSYYKPGRLFMFGVRGTF